MMKGRALRVMHELSIVMNVLDIAAETCRKEGGRRVEAVYLRVGRASGVMPDALRFAFEAARRGTVAGEARLEIEEVPVGGDCRACGRGFTTEEKYVFSCPLCGGRDFRVTSGHELEISELEVDA